jgi:hypothetical protein
LTAHAMLTRLPIDNLAVAKALASQGFHVFPCQEAGATPKRPYSGVMWRSESTTDIGRIERWWKRWPGAIPAIDLGKAGLVVIDADRHGGPDGVAAWQMLTADRGIDAPMVETPGGGQHYYFRQPDGAALGNKEGGLPRGINVRGSGGYVIAPGAAMPDGRRYELRGSLGNVGPAPPWLVDLIRGEHKGTERVQNTASVEPIRLTPRQIDVPSPAYLKKAIGDEIAKLESAAKGSSNNTLNEVAFALGTMVGAGWISRSQAHGWVEQAAWSNVSIRADGRGQMLATIRSGMESGMQSPRPMPEDRHGDDDGIGAKSAAALTRHLRVVSVTGAGDVIDQTTGEVLASPPVPLIAPTETEWERPEGILGEIAEWIYDTTPRSPNWSFATIAAASLIGTVTSRHMCGPTQTGTHLYIAMIGETACGKDRPLRACHQLLHAAGLSCLAISGDFKSQAFLEQQLGRAPVALAAVDEVGSQLLGRLSSRRVSSHESGISGMLRSLWSTGETMQMSGSLTRESITVASPALSIIGASTPEEFYGSLNSVAVTNGFLNRFLIVKGKRHKRGERTADGRIVPKHIIHALLSLLPSGAGNLADGVGPLVSPMAPETKMLNWESDDVSNAYEAFDEELVERRDEDKIAGSLLSRTAETALRLGAIHAYSRDGKLARFTMRDWEWGKTIACRSADIMVNDARSHMSENDYHAKHLLIKRLIRESGTLTRSQLIKRIHGRIPPRETDSVLADLIEAQDIVMNAGNQVGNGKAMKIYTYNSKE